MYKWIFIEVVQNPFDVRDGTKPDDTNALYSLRFGLVGHSGVICSGMSYKALCPLLEIFQVTEPYQLAGKSFESEQSDPFSAVEILILKWRNMQAGRVYTPPTSKEILERAVKALSNMECPDFSDIDGNAVTSAFQEVFNGDFQGNPVWFAEFCNQIAVMSNNTVTLRKVEPDTFSMRVKGPCCYCVLSNASRAQKVLIGPYSPPVEFVS